MKASIEPINTALMSNSYIKRLSKFMNNNNYNPSIKMKLESQRTEAFNKLPSHVQEVLNRAMDNNWNMKRTRSSRRIEKKPLVMQENTGLPLVGVSDDELMVYAKVYSKDTGLGEKEVLQGILNLKQRGNYTMTNTDILQELRQKQAQNAKMDIKQAIGEYYQKKLNNKPMTLEAKQLLSIDDDSGLLPEEMQTRIVFNYTQSNPLREVMKVTSERNLREIPILKYTMDDDIMELKGEAIQLQPIHDRLIANVSESIFHGTEANLTDTIESAMATELLTREVKSLFDESPGAGRKHMSLYNNDIVINKGSNVYEAVNNALQDLPQEIRNHASIVMNFEDYKSVVKELGNKGLGGLASNPDMIWNKKLIIMDEATKPIVGDYEMLHANYENLSIGSQKDIKEGIYTFALPIVNDIRVLLPSAFRIAEVTEG